MAQITFDISELTERYCTAFTLAERGEKVIVTAPPRIPGMHPGSMVMAPDFNDPLPDEFWLSGSP
jgi:hypothetical protein